MARRKDVLTQLDQDIRDYIERETAENIERGMTPENARRAALLKLGNQTLIKEDSRAVWNPVWMEQLFQDIRYGLRMLGRSPGFTAVVVVTLCLGIGLNTAVFSVIQAALLRPLPYAGADRLVWLSDHNKSGDGDFPIERAVFVNWQKHAESFETLAAFADQNGVLIAGGRSEEELLTAIGAGFWSITGARPILGRLFGPGEGNAIVLSYDLFKQSFGSNPQVIGKVVSLDSRPFTVTGVLSEDYRHLAPGVDSTERKRRAYIPIPLEIPKRAVSAEPTELSPTAMVSVVAKLKRNVSLEQAQMEIQNFRSHDPSDIPFLPSTQLRVIPYQDRVAGNIKRSLFILLVAGGLVLLIAVVNIGNLSLARAATRQQEIGTRVALGAGRARVARQFLTESLLLALLGGVAGVGVAQAANVMVVRFGATTIPRIAESRIDGGVLAFAFAISLLATILFGFGPVISLWKAKLNDLLKEGARTVSANPRRRIRSVLVAAEMFSTIILLAGAGLMVKSFWRMNGRPPGFHPDKILTMKISLSASKYSDRQAKEEFLGELFNA